MFAHYNSIGNAAGKKKAFVERGWILSVIFIDPLIDQEHE